MLLVAFMRFLIDNGLLGREAPVGDDPWLDELAVVGTCMTIAGRLGLDHRYVFDSLVLGARSEKMWNEFDEGAGPRARAGLGGAAPPLPAGFDAERFLRLTAGRDLEWLMAASTLILSSHARPNAEELAELVGENSGEWPTKYCLDIVEEMTSPDIGIVLDYDKYSYHRPWQPEVASATHRPRIAAALSIPAAAG